MFGIGAQSRHRGLATPTGRRPALAAVLPAGMSSADPLLDEHHRRFGESQPLVGGGTEPVGGRADADQIAARALRVLYDHLGRIADQDTRLVGEPRAVESL